MIDVEFNFFWKRCFRNNEGETKYIHCVEYDYMLSESKS